MEKISCLASGGVPLHVFVRAVTETCTKASTEGLQGELTNLAIDAVLQMGAEEIEIGEVGSEQIEFVIILALLILSRLLEPLPSLCGLSPTIDGGREVRRTEREERWCCRPCGSV